MLAIVLCVVAMVAYQAIGARLFPKKPASEASHDGKTPAANPPGGQNPANPPGPGGNPAPAGGPAEKPPLPEDGRKWAVPLAGSEWSQVGLTTLGGALRSVTLENAYERS